MKQSLPLYILLILMTLMSCSTSKKVDHNTYFGGEIINPKSDFVLLYKENKLIDSIPLDANHRFTYIFKDFQKGLYTFRHREHQYLYIEPQDSLFLRLNTLEFDETLTFSGKGADKNNFMIKTFLQQESENENNHNLYQLSSDKFVQTTDVLLKNKHLRLERYANQYLFSDDFKKIALAHINYETYAQKELYAYKARKKDSHNLPKNYFDYRKKADYNAEELLDFYPYFNYLNMYVSNVAHQQYSCSNPLQTYTSKLKVIDSVIDNTTIKDHLINKVGYLYFGKKDSPENRLTFINTITKITKNKELIHNMKSLSNQLEKLSVGTTLPHFELIAPNHKKVIFQDLLQKPTVVYFWSQTQPKHLRSVHEKVSKYNKRQYHYIGICIDDNSSQWNKIQQKFKFKNDYLMVNSIDVTKQLMLQTIHKVYVLDQKGVILSNDLNLFDVKFEEKLFKL